MTLQETVKLMCSDDYKDRFKAEYHLLKERTEKLESSIKQYEDGVFDFTSGCDPRLLINQLFSMKLYLDMLDQRAEIEGIDL